jgi:hypothetical protein
MFTLISGTVTVSARTGHILFKKARARNVNFSAFKVYSGETLIVDCELYADGSNYATRNGEIVWGGGEAPTVSMTDAIGNIRLFLDTHRLRNNGAIPTILPPLVVRWTD